VNAVAAEAAGSSPVVPVIHSRATAPQDFQMFPQVALPHIAP